jgi:hypothetical protein
MRLEMGVKSPKKIDEMTPGSRIVKNGEPSAL